MLKHRLTLLLSLIITLSNAQQWDWAAVTAGGGSVDRNILLAKGNSGEFYITGDFQQTQTFGSFTLIPVGNQDVFVAKYDQSGTCLWAIQGGGTFSVNDAFGISTDNTGNVYIGGNYTNQIIFGGSVLNLGVSANNSFIAKFDQAGNCIFLNPIYASVNGATILKNLEKDGLGDFVITGFVYDSVYFGNIGVRSTPGSNIDIYLAKFNPSGTFTWVKTFGGISEDIGFKLSSDASGNIYMGGIFKLTATFGANSVTSYGDFDMFVAKFDNSGNNLWVNHAGATGADQTFGVSNDAAGNTYATGFYYPKPQGMSTLPATFGTTLLTDNGAGNMFICKFDAAGNWVWANKGGGTQHDEGYAIDTDANGNSYVTGILNGTGTFGAVSGFAGFNLVSTGAGDAYIVKYNSAGKGLFAQKIGGTTGDFGKSVLSYSNGECIVAGNFSGTTTINTTPPTTLSSGSSTYRVFLVKYAGGSVGIGESENKESIIGLYPNPTRDDLTLSLMNYKTGTYHFEIIDAYGRIIQSYTNNLIAGMNDVKFNTSTFNSGNYLLRVKTNESTYNQRFTVTK